MSSNLIEFVERTLAKGLERDEITQALRAAGWPQDEVAAALDAFAAVDFPLPVPKPKPHVSARSAFIYLLLFSSLYVSIWHFVSLVFTFIDKAVADPLKGWSTGHFSNAGIRWHVAILIVFFPLFLFSFRLAYRARARDPGRQASDVRKWLTYLTLFIAATCLAGAVMSLIYYHLSGELWSGFFLKVMTVAIVAGGVIVYFLNDVRRDEQVMRRSSLLFLGSATTLVGGAIILGLSIIPAPREQRKLSLDEMRVRDLVAMNNAITAYYRANGHLPASPDALPRSPTRRLADPITDAPYEYIVNDLHNYQVCAVFDTNSNGTMIPYLPEAANWKHETGHYCFTLPVPAPPALVPTTPTQP